VIHQGRGDGERGCPLPIVRYKTRLFSLPLPAAIPWLSALSRSGPIVLSIGLAHWTSHIAGTVMRLQK
jgi:hypothetical protein